jgi:hypothetical protein
MRPYASYTPTGTTKTGCRDVLEDLFMATTLIVGVVLCLLLHRWC